MLFLVLEYLPLINFFTLTDVFLFDVAGDSDTIDRLLAKGVAYVVHSQSINDSIVGIEFTQVVLQIRVAVRHEVSEVHDLIIVLKLVLKTEGVQFDTL